MFIRFERNLSADNWSTQSEDSKRASVKTLELLVTTEAPDFFPLDKPFVKSPCIKDAS